MTLVTQRALVGYLNPAREASRLCAVSPAMPALAMVFANFL